MNELTKIAEESGLPQTKSQALLEIFQEYFGIAAEWEEQAKSIKVTDESQIELMLKAREGRKFLQEARIKLEKTRVAQKQFALLEGRAIDGMANVLKASIVPVESYLKEQEDFVINKRKAEAQARQEQAMRDLEAKEAAEEKALQEKVEAERLENIRLKEEAEKKAAIAQKERDEAVAKQKLIDDTARKEREAHQREIEEKQRLAFEREEKIRVENEKQLAAKEAESKEREEKAEKRRVLGQNRQSVLFKIDVKMDFDMLANMSDVDWVNLLDEKTEEYKIAQEKTLLEKQRAEKEEKRLAEERMESDRKLTEQLEKNRIEQAKILKAKQEKASQVKCPKCNHVFVPPQKLL